MEDNGMSESGNKDEFRIQNQDCEHKQENGDPQIEEKKRKRKKKKRLTHLIDETTPVAKLRKKKKKEVDKSGDQISDAENDISECTDNLEKRKLDPPKLRHLDEIGTDKANGEVLEIDNECGKPCDSHGENNNEMSKDKEINNDNATLNEHVNSSGNINGKDLHHNLNNLGNDQSLITNRTHKSKTRSKDGSEESVISKEQSTKLQPKLEIFTCSTQYQTLPDGHTPEQTNIENEKKKIRKKKKRLPDLKKASSKVGFIHTSDVLPPITQEKLDSHRSSRDTSVGDEVPLTKDDSDKDITKGEQGKTTDFPKPLLLCRIISRFPLSSFFVVTLVHLAVFGTTLGLFFGGYDIFPAVFDTLPLYIFNDPRLKELSWRNRFSINNIVYRPVYGANFHSGYRSQIKDTVEIIFEKPGGNVIDAFHLRQIQRAEDRLFSNANFQRDFCYRVSYDTCLKPQSLLRLFDGTYNNVDSAFTDPSFSNVSYVIYKALKYNETKEFTELFLGKDHVVTPTYCRTPITRSFFLMGWPLARLRSGRYGTFTDLENFLADEFKGEIEHIRDYQLVHFFDIYYLSKIMYEHDLRVQALRDLMLAIGSVSFIFVFMVIQTATVVVTALGIMSILSSFLLTNLIYRYVLQYIYFGFFHIIAIFLILGIGADDLFVFYDTWRLTGVTQYPSDAHRLSDCYRRAAKTTFVTSCTTMMAFLVSGLSPLLPVRTFGIFAGLLVAINYLWVIIYFPTIIILHHTKLKHIWKKFYRCVLSPCVPRYRLRRGKTRHDSESSSEITDQASLDTSSSKELIRGTDEKSKPALKDDETTNRLTSKKEKDYLSIRKEKTDKKKLNSSELKITFPKEKEDAGVNSKQSDDFGIGEPKLNLKEIESQAHLDEYAEKERNKPKKTFEQRNKIVRFLANAFFDFMNLRIVKFLIPLIFVFVSIFFIVQATKIEPDTQQLRLFRSSHNYAKASRRHYFSFVRNNEDEYQRLYLVWGMLPAEVSQCNQKSADYCFGIPGWDDSFDINPVEVQEAFMALCERLENIDDHYANQLRIRRDSLTNKLQISCFTKDFNAFFKKEANATQYGSPKYPDWIDLTLPISPGNVTTFMSKNAYVYRYSLGNNFQDYFQILASWWMTNGYSLEATEDYFHYDKLLLEQRTDQSQHVYYSFSGLYYGTRLRLLAVEVNTTMNVYSLGYEEGLPIYDRWETLIHDINSEMPDGANNGFQVAENLWHWIHVQETLASSAITGIMVGLFSAWPILVLTTFNFIIGTVAVVTIGLVTACVVGLIPIAGWKLGVLESINLCMVVGLSVDYIVHLAEAYRMSESFSRTDRVRDMLRSIGLSVVSGAITTIGAAIFMLFAQIQFFYQFGIFIISTVGISLVFSLFGFTTVMSICGPQGETGSLWKVLLLCCSRKEKGEDDKEKVKCVGISVLTDKVYDWLSYRKNKK